MSDHNLTGLDSPLERLIEALTAQVEASRRAFDQVESAVIPLLERIAVALERGTVVGQGERGDVAGPGMGLGGDPSRIEDLRQRIDAACQANDPDGAMASRDDLAPLLSSDALQEVDRSLVKGLMALIQRRLRTGNIRPDVVELAAKVGTRFGGTTEGASLRASLPTLRRSAGLCPRCGEPYAGLADACPKCVAASSASATGSALPEPVEEDQDDEVQGTPVDWNSDELWQTP